jgi:5-methyltetrahydrofolate--homocysteine methyltransferase
VPEQSEHLKVDQLLDLSRIGMHLTGGYAPDPEQSTLALVAHHPQAIYFGTRQGRIPAEATRDDVIKGSSRDPSLFHTRDGAVPLADDEPEGEGEGPGDAEPAMAGG